MKSERYTFQLLEEFPKAQNDVVVKVGLVSRQIKHTGQIHSIYGLAFYSLVEQTFIHGQFEQLNSIKQYLDYLISDQNILSFEKFWLNMISKWINQMINLCESASITEEAFKTMYKKLMLEQVFPEYDPDNSNGKQFSEDTQIYHLVDCFPLACSFFLMSNASQMEEELKNGKGMSHLSILMGDINQEWNATYQQNIDDSKVQALTQLLKVGLRVYREIGGEFKVVGKYEQMQKNSVEKMMAIILSSQEDLDDFFRLGYDSSWTEKYLTFALSIQKRNIIFERMKQAQQIIQKNTDIQNQKYLQQLSFIQNQIQQQIQQQQVLQQSYQAVQIQIQDAEQKEKLSLQEIQRLKEEGEKLLQQIKTKSKNLNTNTATFNFFENGIKDLLKAKQEAQMIENEERNKLIVEDRKFKEQQKKNKNDFQSIVQTVSKKPQANQNDNIEEVSVPQNIKQNECQICLHSKQAQEIITMSCCAQSFCNECLKQYFQNISTKDKLVCVECKKPIQDFSIYFKQGLLTKNDMNRIFSDGMTSYQCIQCNQTYNIQRTDKNNWTSSIIQCPFCSFQQCKNCLKQRHQRGDICQQRIKDNLAGLRFFIKGINDKITAVKANEPNFANIPQVMDQIKELEKEKRFRFCPDCCVLLLKDDHCEHLDCIECKLSICFTCAAPRSPTLAHSLGCYHREGCKYYEPYNPKAGIKQEKDCKKCILKGSLCDQPGSWQNYQQEIKNWYGETFFDKEFEYNWIQEKPVIQ